MVWLLAALTLVAPTPTPPGTVAHRLADRMADQCTDVFCMDVNAYTVGRGGVTVYGWTYRGDAPIAGFACSRPVAVSDGRPKAVGKTACGVDPGLAPPAKSLRRPLRRLALRA